MTKRLTLAVLALAITTGAALAQAVQLPFVEKFKNATHDPSLIWKDADLKPFGPPNPAVRGADISEYRAKANGVEWVLSQILSEDCSLELCPARLVRIEDGKTTLVLEDMMYIGGPFIIEGKQLRNRDYSFEIGAAK